MGYGNSVQCYIINIQFQINSNAHLWGMKKIAVDEGGSWVHLTWLQGYISQKKKRKKERLGTTALKHTCSEELSESNKCENHTAASYLAPKVGKLQRCGTGGVSGRWMYVVREEHWQRAKCLLNSLRFLEPGCVCVCAQMGEHQTQTVTYCFLLNTWPRLNTTGSLVRR